MAKIWPGTTEGLRSNLARVAPGADEAALRALVGDAMGTYGRYWAEAFRLRWLSERQIDDGFEVEGHHHLQEALASGLGPIMVIPHLGGWEWAAAWLGRVDKIPVTAVVEKLEPADVFSWFTKLRRSFGIELVPLGPDAMAPLLGAIRDGHVLCLLADRDIGETGVTVNFFGSETSLPAGPALLARRSGTVLLPTAVYFRGNKRVCRIEAPIRVDSSLRLRDSLQQSTQEVANALEKLIQRDPGQWHVLQPNWPDQS